MKDEFVIHVVLENGLDGYFRGWHPDTGWHLDEDYEQGGKVLAQAEVIEVVSLLPHRSPVKELAVFRRQ